MVFREKIFAAGFLLLFFSVNALSQEVLVTLTPVGGASVVRVFELEVAQFNLVVVNNEPFEVSNFNAKLSVGPELALVVDGAEKRGQSIGFVSLPANGVVKKTVLVKGLVFSGNPLSVGVNYGFGENLNNFFSTSLVVSKSPLLLNARLEKTGVEPLEEAGLLLDLTNTSGQEIRNLSAGITVPQGFENRSAPLVFSFFAPNQSVQNSVFLFAAPIEPVGEKTVLLVVSFEDSFGPHSVQKSFTVDVRNRNQLLVLLAGIVLVFLLLSVYFYSRKKKIVGQEGHNSSG